MLAGVGIKLDILEDENNIGLLRTMSKIGKALTPNKQGSSQSQQHRHPPLPNDFISSDPHNFIYISWQIVLLELRTSLSR